MNLELEVTSGVDLELEVTSGVSANFCSVGVRFCFFRGVCS
jgi:hypothetical protein